MSHTASSKHAKWHGNHCYFGFHHDLHAIPKDKTLGTRCSPKELVPMLKLAGVEFVQTDSKGHPGLTTWKSKVPGASVAPGMVKDVLAQWRAATRQMGVPLHVHYSGLWDQAAGAKHPDWCLLKADGSMAGPPYTLEGWSTKPGALMCPRGPYLEKLMIPQLLELIDRYDVDGFWIDGDISFIEPCYCPRCRKAYTEETGEAAPPVETGDPRWPAWLNFTKHSFEAYATRYCDAIHGHKPGVLVCSSATQGFRNPGKPTVPLDWLSADNAGVWGLDGSRCWSRFNSTRGKPWDIMLWDFYCSLWAPGSPFNTKPVQMLMQEAAVATALGGKVQVCDAPWEPCGLRTGEHVPWRMKRVGKLGRFVKARRALCLDTETLPQVVVLHSEHHLYGASRGHNLWTVDTKPVEGALFSLLENHYGVDVMDEWALLPRLAEFAVVVVPEQHAMSDEMIKALDVYVASGGKMLVTGTAMFERFGRKMLGVTAGTVTGATTYHLPAADGATPVYSDKWRLLKTAGARALFSLGTTPLLDSYLLPNPGATLNKYGKGHVLYVPADLFRDFSRNRYAMTRSLVGELMHTLAGRLPLEVKAPIGVDVVLRKKGKRTLVHLINRISGIPNQPENGAVDEIPPVGPITITWRRAEPVRKVGMAFEKTKAKWKKTGGVLRITVPSVHIHAAVVIE